MRETKKCNDKELLVRERYREREREDTSYLHGLNKEETLKGTSVQATRRRESKILQDLSAVKHYSSSLTL